MERDQGDMKDLPRSPEPLRKMFRTHLLATPLPFFGNVYYRSPLYASTTVFVVEISQIPFKLLPYHYITANRTFSFRTPCIILVIFVTQSVLYTPVDSVMIGAIFAKHNSIIVINQFLSEWRNYSHNYLNYN